MSFATVNCLLIAVLLLPIATIVAQRTNTATSTESSGVVMPRTDEQNEVNPCGSKTLLDCESFRCQYTNPISGRRETAQCVYSELQRSCLCPRKEASLPCQVHSRDMCEQAECPYAKQMGRDRPNCVWNDKVNRCRSPDPSFFYMLTDEGKIFLVDPDEENIRHIKTVRSGVSIASDRSNPNGLYITTYAGRRGNRLHYFENVQEDKRMSKPGHGRLVNRPIVKDVGIGEGPTSGAIYAAEGNALVRIKVDGKMSKTKVGSGQYHFSGDLATDPTSPDGKMYGLSKSGVFQVDPTTGRHSSILVALPNDRENWALAFTCDGRLYASGGSRRLYEIDLTNRRARHIMTLGVNVPHDFASQPGC
ncbi:uncharacterized protein [Oscarella lobularis]|uniref:uncharacterized protein n=1 Tax=Oscarella lobularis TaxID=121494 RepID=UPI00331349DF